ncbi:MAG: hypothetical protein A3F84_04430 [Candidatus Handelsmanbacteria bacterium RIFCSPLOWO2_12_FULL_64_10]|uniref:GrpB family protein n=1 Tax=Handelsmanbacteria sp. (strain RIFCSPLOWO2_12_FULL_64_10) TaxID=1817868 RepID=A0A1F6C5H9_HANXR|nr:MAG: hypothetical protein A3F84_04430 [Candidatus Handelsmanbacteria bacterium RIFCSPLOWO2_12_FULL_64_10]
MDAETPIVVVDYDSRWPALYLAESLRLRDAIDPWLADLQHVGSTSVRNLAAKPVVDMMGALRRLLDDRHVVPKLRALGYAYHPDFELLLPERRYFDRPGFHLHLVEPTSRFWVDHLRFRELLRADRAMAADYAALKRALASRHRLDRRAYTEGKSEFVKAALTRRAP